MGANQDVALPIVELKIFLLRGKFNNQRRKGKVASGAMSVNEELARRIVSHRSQANSSQETYCRQGRCSCFESGSWIMSCIT
jgi:hypothetical protein